MTRQTPLLASLGLGLWYVVLLLVVAIAAAWWQYGPALDLWLNQALGI